MTLTDIQYSCTKIGNEGPLAYALLERTVIKTVTSRGLVPKGAKYIVVREMLSPFAMPFVFLVFVLTRRFVPEDFSSTYITGGNLRLTFGRRVRWDSWVFSAHSDLSQILGWLHTKELRYVVVTSSSYREVSKVVNRFNRNLELSAQMNIIRNRDILRTNGDKSHLK